MEKSPLPLSRYIGCLMGGAAGDALGAPVEFLPLNEIRHRYGPDGITCFQPAYGLTGAVTDDTQMALFTAEGLIQARVRAGDAPPSTDEMVGSVHRAYLRWLSTQKVVPYGRLLTQHGSCAMEDGILTGFQVLHSKRSPGRTCLTALMEDRMGTIEQPLNPSKGCGAVMRTAPVGLMAEPDRVFELASRIGALTHGHPTGYLAAGVLARIIREIIDGMDLEGALAAARIELMTKPHHQECLTALDRALSASTSAPVSAETVAVLGEGWVADEALAIGLYSALASGGDFAAGIRLAVNHGGDSDSTGAIAGNLLGALLGVEAIPPGFREGLELADLIAEIGEDLFTHRLS